MPLVFQILSGKLVQPETHKGQVLDISYNGMMIESEVRLQKLSEIKLSLALDLFAGKTTDVYARIIKCFPSEDAFRSSMEFTTITRDGQGAVKQFVDQLITSP
tara:strand:+ start:2858 stop:3166 length:309 start_codon:yes stop_codon:yes gene_type:complete